MPTRDETTWIGFRRRGKCVFLAVGDCNKKQGVFMRSLKGVSDHRIWGQAETTHVGGIYLGSAYYYHRRTS